MVDVVHRLISSQSFRSRLTSPTEFHMRTNITTKSYHSTNIHLRRLLSHFLRSMYSGTIQCGPRAPSPVYSSAVEACRQGVLDIEKRMHPHVSCPEKSKRSSRASLSMQAPPSPHPTPLQKNAICF